MDSTPRFLPGFLSAPSMTPICLSFWALSDSISQGHSALCHLVRLSVLAWEGPIILQNPGVPHFQLFPLP